MATGDLDLQWAADVNLTITLASLATDANLLTGRESAAVVSSSQSFVTDFLLSGQVTAGTSPTADKQIQILVYAQIDDTPTYPDFFDGTDSAETITSANVKTSAVRFAAIMPTDSTSDRNYPFGPISVAALFGGVLPERWGVFVTHNTAVNLNSTGSNHLIRAVPVYGNVAA